MAEHRSWGGSVDLSWNLAMEEVLIDDMNQRNLTILFTWHQQLKDGPVDMEKVMLDDVVVYGPVGVILFHCIALVGVGGVLVLGVVVGCWWCWRHRRQGKDSGC